MPPIFVKANLKFALMGREFLHEGESITVFGVSGLRATQFDPKEVVGMTTPIDVKVLSLTPFAFQATASLLAELTVETAYVGLRFDLPPEIRSRLAELISAEGFYPTGYLRKFPRIPARDSLSAMPMRAIVATENEELMALDIANMSPGGVLLTTENPKAVQLAPSVRIHGQIEPRGSMASAFDFDGLICRAMLEKDPKTGNTRHYLGIRFTRIPEEHRGHFLEILRLVLANLQTTGPTGSTAPTSPDR